MRELSGAEVAKGVSELLGSDVDEYYRRFVESLQEQSSKRFLVGRFDEHAYYALLPETGKGFWIGEWGDGGVKGRGAMGAPTVEILTEAAKRRGLL